jgi:hypothetical protein
MSHWTKVKTKLTNTEIVKRALTRMGYEFQEGNFTVTEYGTSEKAEILLDKSLGLSVQDDGTFAFVGDPYHCRTQKLRQYYRKLDKLTTELGTAYAVEEATNNLNEQNFFCTSNEEAEVGEDGLITMTFESYG